MRPLHPPTEWNDAEALVASFARDWLQDPSAQRYGRQGQRQGGIDIIARDRRPDGHGDLWAFQVKCRERLTVADLEEDQARALKHTLRPRHLVFVTTAVRDTKLSDWLYGEGDKPIDVQLWFWDVFQAQLRKHGGGAEWLSDTGRVEKRAHWCDSVRSVYNEARPLQPLPWREAADRTLSEVYVQPRLAGYMAEERSVVPSELAALLAVEGLEKPFFLLLGDAGAGKSVTLLHTANRLAVWAAEDGSRPLPLALTARILVQDGIQGLADALASEQPGDLWRDPVSDWILLVDGLDEISAGQVPRFELELRALLRLPRVRGAVVACRHSHHQPASLAAARRILLQPWSRGQVADFWTRWHGNAQAPTVPHSRNPLELTLAAGQGTGVGGREWLNGLDELVYLVLVEWAEARGGGGAEILEPLLERLAWLLVSEGDLADRRALAQKLAEGEPSSTGYRRLVHRAEAAHGLLRIDEDGTLHTPLRLVVEVLAGRHLAGGTLAPIVAAMSQPKTAEAGRIAALYKLHPATDGSASTNTFRQLLSEAEARSGPARLRQIVVLSRLALWLELGDQDTVEALAEELLFYATEERHGGWRQIAAQAAREALSCASALGDALERLARPLAVAEGQRAAWLERYGDDLLKDAASEARRDFWIGCLWEEDVGVRSVAVRKLAEWKDDLLARLHLVYALLDEGWDDLSCKKQPSLAAGLVFREMDRDAGFQARIPFLQRLLFSGHQVRAGAAALALHKGEAPVEDLAKGLGGAWNSSLDVRVYDAIQALLDEPGVREIILQQRADFPSTRPDDHPWPSVPGVREHIPPSQVVRRTLWILLAPRLARADGWRSIPAEFLNNGGFLAVLCEALEAQPERMFHLLQAVLEEMPHGERPPYLPPRVQHILGQLLRQRPHLVSVMERHWQDQSWRWQSSYPGLALEPLVEDGDPTAIAIYCAWFPHRSWLTSFGQPWRPGPRVFQHAPVREVALRQARDAWDYATRGKLNDRGEKERLHLSSLGNVLAALWPCWSEEEEIVQGLLDRALRSEPDRLGGDDWFGAAMEAWSGAMLPPALTDRLQALVRGWKQYRDRPFFVQMTLSDWIPRLVALGVASKLRPTLEEILRAEVVPAAYEAAWALAQLAPAEATTWSVEVCRIWPFSDDRLSTEHLALLVEAAPSTWIRRLVEVHDQIGFVAAQAVLRLARLLLDLDLDRMERGQVLDALHALTEMDPVWLQRRRIGSCINIAEAARELLFASGEM